MNNYNTKIYNLKTWSVSDIAVWPMVKQLVLKSYNTVSLLLLAVLMAALSTIYVTNETRVMYSDLQKTQNAGAQLQVLQSKLLLENGVLNSQTYVQNVAEKKLHMVPSDNQNTVMVSLS